MDLEKLKLEDVLRDAAREPSAQEVAMVPEEHKALFKELRRTNSLLEWLVSRLIVVNNVVADHDRQLTPIKTAGKIALALLTTAGGIAVVFAWIKRQITSP